MIKAFLVLIVLLLNIHAVEAKDTLVDFQTDYCTSFPEGTLSDPTAWRDCCLMHDMFFWGGGDKRDRDAADLELKACVEEKGYPGVARVIYHGVRLGSYSPIKFENKKWNFGWKDRPEHQKLTVEDIDQIEKAIFAGYDFIPHHIKILFIQELRTRK